MGSLRISLLGKFSICHDSHPPININSSKAWELFGYLALFYTQGHLRDTLAGVIWGDKPDEQARKSLRQALWQLQTTLESAGAGQMLIVTPEWVRLNPDAAGTLDVAIFQQAYERTQGIDGQHFAAEDVARVQQAIALYPGELLNGWDAEWCLYERVRLHDMHLSLLFKLVCYYAAQGEFEAGIRYSERILRYEPAQERTYRMLMCLHYLSGNRTNAMQQYERCCEALQRELSVEPTQQTQQIYQMIREGRLNDPLNFSVPPTQSLQNIKHHIQEVETMLNDAQRQLQHYMQIVETILKNDAS